MTSNQNLVAKELVKIFNDRLVVNKVTISLSEGEVVGLIGPNGAGKTTTFKMMLGIINPDAGTVTMGHPLDGLPLHIRARKGLGYLPQGPSCFFGLNVFDNIVAVLKALKKNKPMERAKNIIEQSGLSKLTKLKASSLSGGERRRLEFARALCSEPKFLLCDEPFSGVDPIASEKIGQTLRKLARDGVGVMITSHNVEKTKKFCDRIYLIYEGRILIEGQPEEVFSSEKAKRLYLG